MTSIEFNNMGTVNKNCVYINDVELYFSYCTLVAVRGSEGLKVAINEWSKTTGKLLNELNADHTVRIPHYEILAYAQRELKKVTLW